MDNDTKEKIRIVPIVFDDFYVKLAQSKVGRESLRIIRGRLKSPNYEIPQNKKDSNFKKSIVSFLSDIKKVRTMLHQVKW